jgi:hypothetical protein
LVADVLSGASDWTSDEVAEFGAWLRPDPRIEAWSQQAFDEIDAAIRNSNVWQSPLWTDD